MFKKEYKIKEPQQRNTFIKRTGQFQLSNKWKGKTENESELDEDGRPHHKVVFLALFFIFTMYNAYVRIYFFLTDLFIHVAYTF